VVEQPLPAGEDSALANLEHAVPICADESFHDRGSFERIEGHYDMVNIKLDKAGGLSEALHCLGEARRRGVRVMVGCMVSTSLAIEPALLLAASAEYVDLDGSLLLDADREGALHDRRTGVLRPSSSIWGAA
jgi:L-alanine-DL-glutamate epimerase-like enolase superfamily enzyme